MNNLQCYHVGNLAYDRGSYKKPSERTAREAAIDEKAAAVWKAYEAGKCILHIKRVNGDPDYFDVACKRVREAYAQPDMFVEQAKPLNPVQEGFDL